MENFADTFGKLVRDWKVWLGTGTTGAVSIAIIYNSLFPASSTNPEIPNVGDNPAVGAVPDGFTDNVLSPTEARIGTIDRGTSIGVTNSPEFSGDDPDAFAFLNAANLLAVQPVSFVTISADVGTFYSAVRTIASRGYDTTDPQYVFLITTPSGHRDLSNPQGLTVISHDQVPGVRAVQRPNGEQIAWEGSLAALTEWINRGNFVYPNAVIGLATP
jgi:hypothetical protein